MSDHVNPGAPVPATPTPGTPTPGAPARSARERRGQGQGQGQGYGGYGSYGGYGGYSPYGGPVGPDGGARAKAAQLVGNVKTIYRHRWIALTTAVVIFLIVAVQTFTATPIYQARVQLLLEPENPNVVSFKQVIDQEQWTEEYYRTQFTILQSRALARRTINTLKLWENPEFGGSGGQKKTPFSVMGTVRGATSAATGWVMGLFSGPPKATASVANANETAAQSGLIDAFLGGLSVTPIRNSRLVDIEYASPDPAMAATIINTVAKQYIEQNLEYKFLSSKEASDWLGQQLVVERKKLEDSERALQEYREQGDAVALEDRQNIVVQRLTDLNTAYTKARTDRFEKEALYSQLSSLQNNRSALDTFPAILSNTFIQQLKSQLSDLQRQRAQMAERLGDKHPDMIKLVMAIQGAEARLDAEINKVVQSVHNEFLSAQAQERSLAGALEGQKRDALSLNAKGIQYGVLRREAESNKLMYDALMQRSKETGISGELKTSNIRIVDQAEVPRSPILPRKSRDLLLGLLGGLMAGIALAFVVEYVDNRIRNPEELKQLGLSFLGLIPALGKKEMVIAGSPFLHDGVPTSFTEAFRAIRTNVLFSTAEAGSRSMVITSTQPGEGKTTVAANLAMTLAQTGQRVLLVDADMRKSRHHDIFKIPTNPGLSSILVGVAKPGEAVVKTAMPSLWVLPAGPHPPNPSELLGSARFKDLLASFQQNFDWVILDAPPVMAVTDASVVAHLTNGVVFIVGCEQVSRYMVGTALEQLRASKATIMGFVLNRVNLQRNPYYYSHYYKREYATYYSSDAKT
ncbi:MAG: polysaccharide biosynthesis tyrosine autokinase [Acidobacteria bacterium]|nr:polysaccharide biosynthesis tyrosine autokinase [Acidobacteriota bacterium]